MSTISKTSTRITPSLNELLRPAMAFVALALLTIVVGKFSLLDSVKEVDESVFDSTTSGLQSIPGLVTFCKRATKFGAIPVDYGIAIGAAGLLALQARRIAIPALIIVSLFSSHLFQKVVIRLVDGTSPLGDNVLGESSSYYSGGVQRVILLVGMIATVAQSIAGWNDKSVWRMAIAAGLFEAVTRLVLGLHWPLDVLASFPIGLSLLWIFRQLFTSLNATHFQQSFKTTEEPL